MKKNFTKNAYLYDEANFKIVKKLLEAGLSAKEIYSTTGWSTTTVYATKNVKDYQEYRKYTASKKVVADVSKEKAKDVEPDLIKIVTNISEALKAINTKLDLIQDSMPKRRFL